jgi:hypothetical protein
VLAQQDSFLATARVSEGLMQIDEHPEHQIARRRTFAIYLASGRRQDHLDLEIAAV